MNPAMNPAITFRIAETASLFKGLTGESPTNLYVGRSEYRQIEAALAFYPSVLEAFRNLDRPVVMDLKIFRVDADNHLEVS